MSAVCDDAMAAKTITMRIAALLISRPVQPIPIRDHVAGRSGRCRIEPFLPDPGQQKYLINYEAPFARPIVVFGRAAQRTELLHRAYLTAVAIFPDGPAHADDPTADDHRLPG